MVYFYYQLALPVNGVNIYDIISILQTFKCTIKGISNVMINNKVNYITGNQLFS